MNATTIDEVIADLGTIIQTAKTEESPLGYFPALYRKVTQRIKDKLGQNYFDDDVRMEELDVIFANRYLKAYSQYHGGEEPTKSWLVAFQATQNNKLIVLQHLLLGMNAHINLDLGIAAAQISTPSTIASLQDDFNKINDILAELVDEVERDLAKIWPFLLWILKVTKKIDNFLINFSMTIARDGAWKFANELVQATDKDSLIAERDQKIANLAQSIICPGRIERFVLWIIRFSERGSPSQKIAALE